MKAISHRLGSEMSHYTLKWLASCMYQTSMTDYSFYALQALFFSWRYHCMQTLSALLVLGERKTSVIGGFPSRRVKMWHFDVVAISPLNKLLNKQSVCWWFEALWYLLTSSLLISLSTNMAVTYQIIISWDGTPLYFETNYIAYCSVISLTHESKVVEKSPDSKVRGANMGPIWGRQDPGGPHVGPMNFAIWDGFTTKSVTMQVSLNP